MTNGTATTDLDATLEQYRVELTGYCYRMLGSSFEAEDAVQDTMIRAWRSLDKFEGRSSLRSWLYRIATNVCLDMLSAGNKRARPMDLTEPTPLAQAALSPRPDHTWLEPMPDDRVLPTPADPAEAAVAKESVRLAFMAALQRLPAKQRAVLILREVLAWKASEVAELLGTSVASVNSALQRARATLAERQEPGADAAVADPLDEDQKKLLDRYVAAFEGYDMSALTALLHEDAIMTMPPFDLWLTGADDITGFMTTMGASCANSKLVPVEVNGLPGFAHYKPDPENGGYTPWAIQVLEISDGRITGFHCFLDTQRWFPLFGLPLRLEAETDEVEQSAERG
ncbi:sigma-70 family RNA polymerase sigma factor [Streptomyces cellulosae]|uniref:Sigma-70 family RNA polymerase sigma factor n=1 Tax=Streptomyces thermocarboxydus TaxID=59299 RepID=A0ABU3JHM7_9ACTN|nr:sigma-70 family RNA polymerase sigma factor [Streptomyces cellulosae]MDT6974545.1 sigma-70 family RNA polymerase sigma factor [Streptomyces thermocarboxydus]WSB92956.1 sigma-70 family RNA polymerase sigma factor [Streptomyces cellulosae]WTC56296.1 sigma-70 family RNA polymerase sigma factor [Streptomyces cellulosae]